MKIQGFAAAALLAAISVAPAHATGVTILSGDMTADNGFEAFISTSNSVLGTLVASGSDWQSATSFSTDLVSGQTYYLHVIADNQYGVGGGGNPDAFLASLSLSGTADHFVSQGVGYGQSLVTGVTGWTSYSAPVEQLFTGPGNGNFAPNATLNWTAGGVTPVSFGFNGGNNIWGNYVGPISGISATADWIWSPTDRSGEAYFSTQIVASSAVPETSTWIMMLAGFAAIGFAGYRRTKPARLTFDA